MISRGSTSLNLKEGLCGKGSTNPLLRILHPLLTLIYLSLVAILCKLIIFSKVS
jgi:hypothetical protein